MVIIIRYLIIMTYTTTTSMLVRFVDFNVRLLMAEEIFVRRLCRQIMVTMGFKGILYKCSTRGHNRGMLFKTYDVDLYPLL